MKYILLSTLFAFVISFFITNCAKENYRHPTDPHADDYANMRANERTNIRNDEQAQIFSTPEIRAIAEQADSANDAMRARIALELRKAKMNKQAGACSATCDTSLTH